MYHKHKIIPKGAVAWENNGNNKAYQSRQVLFVLNPTSLYASLVASDKELSHVTGLLPMPAGLAGVSEVVGERALPHMTENRTVMEHLCRAAHRCSMHTHAPTHTPRPRP